MGRASVGGTRSISIDNGEFLLSDDWTSFNCWDGPTVAVTEITDTAVSFKDYRPPVTIANGSSASVGTYQITVLSIDGDTATFKVVAPSG